MIKLVPIDDLRASNYNPRKNDERRLRLTELSLRKLGFVLPIYADVSGEILSGHQRQLVARRLGFTHMPVEYCRQMDLEERKAINMLFNRATNDLKKSDTSQVVTNKLMQVDIDKLSEELPDIEPNSEESFPCVYNRIRMDSLQLAKKNHKDFDIHVRMLAKNLQMKTKTIMPVVIGQEDNVINGIGRLQVAVEEKQRFIYCVRIKKEQEELARAMLNLLTMDFSMDGEYADVLRYNAFMREYNTRETDEEGNCAFGDGFFKGLFPKNNGRDFMRLEGNALKAWVAKYGDKIVDFGAGKLNNTRTLRRAGVFVSAFEPYFVTTGAKVHKAKSVEIAEKFLEEVASGVEYTSVFISSVYNSVPFMADRKKIAWIAAALCSPKGQVVCWCQSHKTGQFISNSRRNVANNSKMSFDINYEPHTSIGQPNDHPKVQKGHTSEELYEIFSPCFGNVKRCDMIGTFWYLEADKPIVDPVMLAEAIDFEFELPYPDGSTLGLSEKARAAFEKRLGIKLPERAGKGGGEDGED